MIASGLLVMSPDLRPPLLVGPHLLPGADWASVYLDSMNASAAALIASAISAIVAMAVVTLQYSLERRKQSLAQRADRLGDFLSATYAAARGIEEIAIAPSTDKPRAEIGMRSAAQDRLNNSLTRLRLFEDAETVASATRLERELTRLIYLAQRAEFSRNEWRGQRSGLAGMTHEYETIARRKLRRRQLHAELSFYAPENSAVAN